MITRTLTQPRYERFCAHTPPRDRPDLMGFYDADRIFTTWMKKEFGHGLVKYERFAYDFRGPQGFRADEFDVGSVFFANESGCWGWKVRTPQGHRSGFEAVEDDANSLPVRCLSLVDGHLLGGMAHEKFCVGSVTSEVLEVAPRLPREDGVYVVSPWTRYRPKRRHSRDTDSVEFHRLLIAKPSRYSPVLHPHYTKRRMGSVRAALLARRMGSQQAATVKSRGRGDSMVFDWRVDTPSVQSAGQEGSLEHAVLRCEAALADLDIWVSPAIVELEIHSSEKGATP